MTEATIDKCRHIFITHTGTYMLKRTDTTWQLLMNLITAVFESGSRFHLNIYTFISILELEAHQPRRNFTQLKLLWSSRVWMNAQLGGRSTRAMQHHRDDWSRAEHSHTNHHRREKHRQKTPEEGHPSFPALLPLSCVRHTLCLNLQVSARWHISVRVHTASLNPSSDWKSSTPQFPLLKIRSLCQFVERGGCAEVVDIPVCKQWFVQIWVTWRHWRAHRLCSVGWRCQPNLWYPREQGGRREWAWQWGQRPQRHRLRPLLISTRQFARTPTRWLTRSKPTSSPSHWRHTAGKNISVCAPSSDNYLLTCALCIDFWLVIPWLHWCASLLLSTTDKRKSAFIVETI